MFVDNKGNDILIKFLFYKKLVKAIDKNFILLYSKSAKLIKYCKVGITVFLYG